MQYLCPKCKSLMQCFSTASVPPIVRYECFNCGYSSKPIKEKEYAMELPEEWRSEDTEGEDYFEIQSDR